MRRTDAVMLKTNRAILKSAGNQLIHAHSEPEDNDSATAQHPSPLPIKIQPSAEWFSLQLDVIWTYRELLYFLVWRDLKVRYKQTILGVSWAIIQPLTAMLIFSLFFGRLAKVPSDGFPYPLFVYAALVPWTLFSNALTQASNTLVINANMIKKLYFPRITMPIASVLAGGVDFVFAFSILLVMMLFYGISPTLTLVWVPLLLLLALVASLGVSLWLSAMNVQFRDVRYALPFLTQIWLFSTPVVYPSSLLSEPWRTLYAINPMVGVVEGFRWALLGAGNDPQLTILVSFASAGFLLLSGLIYFNRMEKTFADVV